jgi:hypothetical protein
MLAISFPAQPRALPWADMEEAVGLGGHLLAVRAPTAWSM